MSYILASLMFLQILLYNTMVDATAKQTKDCVQYTNNNSFDELKNKLDKHISQYKNCETLYDELVKNFISKHQIETSKVADHGYRRNYEIVCPFENENNIFELNNQDYIPECHEKIKISENEEIFYNYHTNLFLDCANFVFKTFNEILKLIKSLDGDIDKTLENIGKDGKLMKKLILSCNWIQKIIGNTRFSTLYSIYRFNVYRFNTDWITVEFDVKFEPENNIDATNENIKNMQEYINIADKSTLQEIVAYYKFEEASKFFVEKDSNIYLKCMKVMLMYVTTEMSLQTKITYLAKTKYYNLDEETEKYERTQYHKETITNLNIEKTIPHFYKVNISAYCMYELETIYATTNVILLINKNINDRLENTKILTKCLFDNIKGKICDVLINTISTNADQLRMQINKIENPIIEDILNNPDLEKIEEITKDFFGKIFETIKINEENTNTNLSKTNKHVMKELKQSISINYLNIIKNVKELSKKIEENKTMLNDFILDLTRIIVFTDQIGDKSIDAENIYLGLDTTNINNQDIADSIQNKRKLCKLRIIEIMEKVITYKKIIVEIENSMFTVLGEIERTYMQTYTYDAISPVNIN